MPRTYGRIKVEVWESGSDFRRLPIEAQWLYLMLVSQPSVTMAGTLTFMPRKWARLGGISMERFQEALDWLVQARFVIVDTETEELLVRSFVKHDEPWRLPNNLTGVRSSYRAVESELIRGYLRERHPWLDDLEIAAEAVKEYERDHDRENGRTDARENDRTNDRTNASRVADVASPSPPASPIRGEAAGGESSRATALEAPLRAGADELPQEVAFREANRFVVTSGGWQDPQLEQTLRHEWPELIEEDVGSLLATADEMREREVA